MFHTGAHTNDRTGGGKREKKGRWEWGRWREEFIVFLLLHRHNPMCFAVSSQLPLSVSTHLCINTSIGAAFWLSSALDSPSVTQPLRVPSHPLSNAAFLS
jgi:hypothetical protein